MQSFNTSAISDEETSMPRQTPSIITSSIACLNASCTVSGSVSKVLKCVFLLMKSIMLRMSLMDKALRDMLKYV